MYIDEDDHPDGNLKGSTTNIHSTDPLGYIKLGSGNQKGGQHADGYYFMNVEEGGGGPTQQQAHISSNFAWDQLMIGVPQIHFEDLVFEHELGSGFFGQVFKGEGTLSLSLSLWTLPLSLSLSLF